MSDRTRLAPVEPTRDMIEAAYPLLDGMPPRKAKELCRLIFREMMLHAPLPKRNRITPNQRRVLEVVAEGIDAGRCPTVREIARILNHCDHSQSWRTLRSLKRKGIVDIGPGPRDVHLLFRPEEI